MQVLYKILAFGLLLLIIGYFAIRIWTTEVLKEHIAYAKTNYSGIAEDVMIEMLKDDSAPANDKTHIAIWTLGQLRSEKALPVLRNLYKDDPEGNSCYGRHDSVICQYELYKAIRSIEGNTLISFAHLNK
jgi:hypothetical protein